MRYLSICLAVVLAVTGATQAQAQDQTLADIRQELTVLFVEVQRLKRELSTTGGVGTAAAGGDVLQRVDLIEAELSRLTSKTEELEFRINQVVRDGTNRIGDLEFRLCELEANCDVAQLATTSTLGGEAGAAGIAQAPTLIPPPSQGGTELAVGEQADFDRAKAALDSGDFRSAADLFETFTATYTGGPLTSQAQYYRGRALAGLGETAAAARSYLNSFSGAPDGPVASEALLELGIALAELGQVSEACVTLAEVGTRFPGTLNVSRAEEERRRLACS